MNADLLILMPTRNRPERMKEAVQSFIDTTDGTHSELRMLIDTDEPQFDRYIDILEKDFSFPNISYAIREPLTYTQIINREFEEDYARKFYCVTNDDIIFQTQHWDKILSIDWAITTGHEPNMHEYHGKKATTGFPIISVIDGRICRELGWLQYPKLRQSCGDNVWHILGVKCKNLLYTSEVVYVHNHAYFGKSRMDEHYHKLLDNDYEFIKKDFNVFMEWAKYESLGDVKKVRDLIERNIGKFALKRKVKS